MENKNFTEKVTKLDGLFDRTIELVNKESNYSPDDENIKEVEKNLKEGQRKCQDQTFQIGVLALVKSGKSTFINSLLGAEYLPTSNIPETAGIVKIIHSKEHSEGQLLDKDNEKKIVGSKAIFDYIKGLNEKTRKENYKNVSEKELILKAPIECLKEKAFGDIVFEILDTPGPNEAGAEPLKYKIKRLLEEIDVIIYLLDYTKLKTEEEKKLVDEIAKRKDLIDNRLDRLFFIVNKVDMENRNSLTVQKTPEYVCKVLKEKIPNISKERILVVAAEKALLSRLILNKTDDKKVINDFAKRTFGEDEYEEDKATIDDCEPKAPKSLEKSHLSKVEKEVISFLFKNIGPTLVKSLSNSLKECIRKFDNCIKVSEKAIQQTKEELKAAIQKLEKDIEKSKEDLGKINNIAGNTEAEMSNWIDEEYEEFRTEILEIINGSFQYKNGKAENSDHSWVRKFVKKAARTVEDVGETINVFFSQRDKIIVKNKKKAYKIFRKVNKKIERTVKYHFEDFRNKLEEKALSKQKELYSKFEEVVNDMARKIEQKVGKQLEIKLDEVEIKFPTDSIEEIHEKIQKGTDQLIKRVEKMEQKKTREKVLREENWFSDDEYGYVDKYKNVRKEVYNLSKSDLKKFWLKLIDDMNKASIKTAKHLATKDIKELIKKAKGEVENYTDGYVTTIRRELKEKEKGKEKQEERAEMLSQSINELNQISQELEEIKPNQVSEESEEIKTQ